MKKIKWEKHYSSYHAIIGCIHLQVILANRSEWQSRASIRQIAFLMRRGPLRRKLQKSKEDAVRLAQELLIDCHTSIGKEMKRLGCDTDD